MGTLNTQLVLIRGDSPVLHAALGPYIGRAEIERELGGPIRNGSAKLWCVAFADGDVVGFAGMDRELIGGRRVAHLRSAYVLPAYRRQGIYRAMLQMRLDASGGASLRAVATDLSVAALERAGLREVRMKGRYHVMEMDR